MTEFARLYADLFLRARAGGIALACGAVILAQILLPSAPLVPLALLLAIGAVLSFLVQPLQTRVGETLPIHAVLLYDLALIAVVVYYSGGLGGGFALLYILVVVSATLFLGVRWGVLYALLAIGAFGLEAALELEGWRVFGTPAPLPVQVISQLATVVALVIVIISLTLFASRVTQRWRAERSLVVAEREEARRASRHWALINAVAVRVQESTTPQQVYSTIGEELEKMAQHCAILEWDETGTALHPVYFSFPREHLDSLNAQLRAHLADLRIVPAEVPELARALETHTCIAVDSLVPLLEHLFPGAPREAISAVLRPDRIRMLAYAPMLNRGRTMGVITVWGGTLTKADLPSLAALAQQAASAIDKAKLLAEQNKRAGMLALASEIAAQVSRAQEIQPLFAQVCQQVGDRFGYHVVGILLADRETNEAQIVAAHGLLAERVGLPYRQSLDRGIIGHVYQTGRTYLARDTRTDPYYIYPLEGREDPVRSELTIPIGRPEQMIGVLDVQSTAVDAFDQSDIDALEILAEQLAAAIEKARLYQLEQARTRELQALAEASRHLNQTLDIPTILQASVDSLKDKLGYHHVSIYFVHGDTLRLEIERGYENVLQEIPLARGVMGRAVRTRQVVYLPDVQGDPDFIGAIPNVQSEIAIPLRLGDEVLGVLNVETVRGAESRKEFLTPSDLQLLTTFANQLVTAIANARLFAQTQQQLAELGIVHAASQALNADLELDVVLERVARQFVAALEVDSCTLLRWDRERNELQVLFDLDPLPRARVTVGERYPVGASTAHQQILADGQPHGYRFDDPALDAALREDFARYEWKSVLLLPLIRKGQVSGIIELGDRRQARAFSADEVRLAESLASQASAALENARLYHDAQKRLEETQTLYGFAHELGAMLDIEELGRRALEAAARIAPYDMGEVSLVRESDGALVTLVLTGRDDLLAAPEILPRGVGIMGWVAEHGQPARVGNVTRDPRYKMLSPRIRSEICLPLRASKGVIGVLNLEAEAPNAFDAHAEQLLMAFANQLAIAVENAQLYGQTRRDAEVKAALLRELSHRVKNNLAAITSLLYMALDEPPENRDKILSETLGRVQSMALAHALLARSPSARVDLLELGRQVLNDTVRTLGDSANRIQVAVTGTPVEVAARQTTTLALALSELVTNSLRHGLNRRRPVTPQLQMRVERQDGHVCVELEDNGGGVPEDFNLESDAGLGLNLVRTLVEVDLRGQFRLERGAEGTRAVIRFQLEE